MSNWKRLTPRAERALTEAAVNGEVHADNHHGATLRSLCRRDILERVESKQGVIYLMTLEAAHDLRTAYRLGYVALNVPCYPYRLLWEQCAPIIDERANQAQANILAGLSSCGYDFDTRQVMQAPIRLIVPDVDQYAVVNADDETVWVDQTYDDCIQWIREQFKREREVQHA